MDNSAACDGEFTPSTPPIPVLFISKGDAAMGCPLVCQVSNLQGETMLDSYMAPNENRTECDSGKHLESVEVSNKLQINNPEPHKNGKHGCDRRNSRKLQLLM